MLGDRSVLGVCSVDSFVCWSAMAPNLVDSAACSTVKRCNTVPGIVEFPRVAADAGNDHLGLE